MSGLRMEAPRVKNEITVGSIASWITILCTIVGFGVAIGQDRTDIAYLKAQQSQTAQDSRALIRMEADMAYIKRTLDELKATR